MKNDHRADHRVNPVGNRGYNVEIPYRGYIISLAADGGDTRVYDKNDEEIVGYGQIYGTNGEAIRKVMDHIDKLVGEQS